MGGRKSSEAGPCTICGEPMRKNGTTSSGGQRWRCMRAARAARATAA
ncbi:transposase-like zinc-binding domain-containing protein, partial [Bifidobacterium subtile]